MENVILKGYYGRDNFGDEIMLDLIVSYFKKNYPFIKLQIMNSNPEMILKKYGIETANELITGNYGKTGIVKRILTIIRADCYIIGGGTIITDKHSSLHLFEYLLELSIRKFLGKPSVFISIGATKFKHSWSIVICKLILCCCELCMVRDSESFKMLRDIYNDKKIVQTGDLVLLAFKNDNKKKESHSQKKIGFSLMPYYESLYKKNEMDIELANKIAKIIDILSKKGFNVSLIPIQYGYNNELDYKFSKLVKSFCQSKTEILTCYDSEGKMKEIETMDYIVSMRLHALLFAIFKNKKVIAISHNEKIDSCMKVYNINNQTVTMNKLDNIIEIVQQLQYKKFDYHETVYEQMLLAEKNFSYLTEILNRMIKDV